MSDNIADEEELSDDEFSIDDLLGEDLVDALREEMRRTKILVPNVERLRFANEIYLQIKEILNDGGYEYEIQTKVNPLLMTCLHINILTPVFSVTPQHVSLFQDIVGKANGINFSGGRIDDNISIDIRIMDAFIDAAERSSYDNNKEEQ